MFQHQSCLRHLLTPFHYTDPEHYQREVDEVFRSTWQFACTRQEIAHDGDFITLELFGEPVLMKNFGGEIRAFLNVCPHRHCMLTSEPTGNSPGLFCQYHGWEFKQDGCTGKIPEAKAFRPWDRDNSQLHTLGLETCGDLIFICFEPQRTPPLKQWLDPFYGELEHAFQAPLWRMAEVWDFESASNWKIPTENTLESYHVATVHPTWLGEKLPEETLSEHDLDGRYTTLRYDCDSPMEEKQAKIGEYLGATVDHSYRHWHIHPNIAFCLTDTFNYLATCQPTSPTTCQIRTRMFALHGTRRNPYAKLLRYMAWRIGRRTMRGIFNEDRAIFDAQQRGIQSSRHRGVIGTREERIHVFQRYLCNRMNLNIAPDPAVERMHEHTKESSSPQATSQHTDSQHTDSQHTDSQHTDSQHTDSQHTERSH